jgi:hypothetical protein
MRKKEKIIASPTGKVKEQPKEKYCTFSCFVFFSFHSNRVAKLTAKIAVEHSK